MTLPKIETLRVQRVTRVPSSVIVTGLSCPSGYRIDVAVSLEPTNRVIHVGDVYYLNRESDGYYAYYMGGHTPTPSRKTEKLKIQEKPEIIWWEKADKMEDK